jgi:phosphohistidine phosphatase
MQLFLVRHAIAEDLPPERAGRDDADRELTEEGKTRLRRAARGLRSLGIRFERVLTSPWKRAAQTARLLEPIASTSAVVTDLLARPPSQELLAVIAGSNETTAVVGHEPWLGELAAWLAFGDARHGDAIAIKKTAVVWLAGTAVPGGMQLRALLPPKVLRALG